MKSALKRLFLLVVFICAIALTTTALAAIQIPLSTTVIESEAFYGDTSLGTVTVPEGTLRIESKAFAQSALQEVFLPQSLEYIADDAFDGCPGLVAKVFSGTYAYDWCVSHNVETDYPIDETPIEYFTWEAINGLEASITGYTGTNEVVRIPSEVEGLRITTIANSAFSNNLKIKYVIIPDSIFFIEPYSFFNCNNLAEVHFSKSLVSIGNGAFENCTSLLFLGLPEGVETIGWGAFKDCCNLEEVQLPDSITTLGPLTFYRCTKLRKINLPLSWKDVSSEYGYGQIFYECKSLTSIIVPEGITKLPECAFDYAEYLTEIVLPSTLEEIGARAFENCSGLFDIQIPSNVEKIGSYAFYDCSNLSKVTMSLNCKEIGSYAFYNCTNLTEITLPDSITRLGGYVFGNCCRLPKINIPSSWSLSGGSIFENCPLITEISIPEGVSKIPNNAFENCEYIEYISLPKSLLAIGIEAFENCTSLSTIEIPSVQTIDYRAFYNCNSLSTIVLPSGIESIGSSAFYNCSSLSNVQLPDGLTQLGYSVFSNCSRLSTINIPEGLTEIPSSAFDSCTALRQIILPSTLKSIGGGAFINCANLVSVTLPSCERIENGAFNNCIRLSQIELPEGITHLGEYAFYNCLGLTEIQLPDSIGWLGHCTFGNCKNLTTINIPTSWWWVSHLGGEGVIFENCSSLTSIVVPEGVTALPQNAFTGAEYLVNVSLPNTLVEIGFDAFKDCKRINRLYISPNVTEIKSNAFKGATNLKIYCEYGSYALQYAINNSIPYFYLTLTDYWLPSGVLYQGDVYPISGMVRCSDTISNVTVELYAADGTTLLRSGSVSPGEAYTVNVKQLLNHYINISTLGTGTYVYKIVATGGEETEVFATSSFTIVPPPVRISKSGCNYPKSYVAAGSSVAVSGTVSSNHTLTNISARIQNRDTGSVVLSWNATPLATAYSLASLCGTINTTDLPNGEYLFIVAVTANGEYHTVINSAFVLGNTGSSASGDTGTGSLNERKELAIKLASTPNNRNAFITYTNYMLVFDELGYDDAFNAALNIDYLSEAWNQLIGYFKNHGANESIVRLYKKALAEIIDTELAPQEVQFTAANTTNYKFVVDFIKEGGKLTSGIVDNALKDQAVSEGVKAGFKDILAITEAAEFMSKIPNAADVVIDILGILLRDYEGGYNLLLSLAVNTQYADAEFEVALNELLMEYTDAYMNSYSQLVDRLASEAAKKGTAAAVELLNISNFSLKKLAVKLILELSGSTKEADAYKDFYISANLYFNLIPAYYSAFDKVAGGDTSDQACEDLYNMYVLTHEAGLRLYDAAIRIGSDDIISRIESDRERLEALTFSQISTYGIPSGNSSGHF